ncbi:MAG TPA: DinB family protein [Vicinamibacteria bacterium]
MSDTQAMARLFAYGEWANHRFLDAVVPLDAEAFGRDLKGSHGGIRGTLVHTYGAEWVWHQRFHGASPPALPGEDQIQDLTTLRERWTALEAERREWLAGLEPGAGERVIDYRTFKGDAFSGRLLLLVQHVANHGSYHRGQLAVFLRQLGVKPPTTDLVAFDRERAKG